MCDDLLKMLLERVDHFQCGLFTIDELRPRFWALVFSDGWNTSIPISAPSPFTAMKQKGVHTSVYIGHTRDIQPEDPPLEASYKVTLTASGDLLFGWYCSKGPLIRTENVACLRERDELKADAISKRDADEISWVSQWNSSRIKFWGRRHLLSYVSWLNGEAALPVDGLPQNIGSLQKHGLFRQILLNNITRERVEIGRIAQNHSAADLYGNRQRDQIRDILDEDELHLNRLKDARELLKRLSTAPSQLDLSVYFW